MKKIKTKPKAVPEKAGASGSRGQVVKLKPGKVRTPWFSKLPPVKVYFNRSRTFLEEVVRELKQVTWPNRKETLGTTGVVLVLVFILAAYLGLVDYALSHIVRFLID
ncbi:MAG TPA: preprotein translocase subunit SecE [Desulfobaccales bacterium]